MGLNVSVELLEAPLEEPVSKKRRWQTLNQKAPRTLCWGDVSINGSSRDNVQALRHTDDRCRRCKKD
jgi:hypothetical protein